jgi:hypothetical protein
LLLKNNFWKMGVWDDAAQVAQVRELQAQYGGGMDEPIWRFRLPSLDHGTLLSTPDSIKNEKKD